MKIYTFDNRIMTTGGKWMEQPSTPPSTHTRAFSSCGEDTVTGAAELAQIPSDWK